VGLPRRRDGGRGAGSRRRRHADRHVDELVEACGRPGGSASRNRGPGRGERHPGEGAGGLTRTDTQIAQAVRQALEWDVFVPDQNITSTVTDGCVTLEGAVDRWSQRNDAERPFARREVRREQDHGQAGEAGDRGRSQIYRGGPRSPASPRRRDSPTRTCPPWWMCCIGSTSLARSSRSPRSATSRARAVRQARKTC